MNKENLDYDLLLEELARRRVQQNDLQIELEKYTSNKKLIKLLIRSYKKTIKDLFTKQPGTEDVTTVSPPTFQSQSPLFKPYVIQIKEKVRESRPRVLHAIPCFTTGGSQQLVVDIVEGLGHLYEQEILVRYHPGPQGYVGVPVTEFAVTDENCEANLYWFVRQQKPAIVHVHYWGQYEEYDDWKWYHLVFQAAMNNGCKIIENCNNPKTPYFHRKINKYVYVSKYAEWVHGIPSEQNQVVYPGSNFSLFTAEAGHIPPADCIGMVYRLDRDKLNKESIEVFIEVVRQRPQTKALIVGGVYYYDYYQQRVQEEGMEQSFIFTGYVSYQELPHYYRQMTVFVAPVHKESFGQVTPFAMNMGIPVVGYHVGALPEILENTDLLADKGNIKQLAAIILGLLDNEPERTRIGAFNRQKARQYFSLETMVDAYRQIYADLIG